MASTQCEEPSSNSTRPSADTRVGCTAHTHTSDGGSGDIAPEHATHRGHHVEHATGHVHVPDAGRAGLVRGPGARQHLEQAGRQRREAWHPLQRGRAHTLAATADSSMLMSTPLAPAPITSTRLPRNGSRSLYVRLCVTLPGCWASNSSSPGSGGVCGIV